jgi:hypothetical protein
LWIDIEIDRSIENNLDDMKRGDGMKEDRKKVVHDGWKRSSIK